MKYKDATNIHIGDEVRIVYNNCTIIVTVKNINHNKLQKKIYFDIVSENGVNISDIPHSKILD